MYRLEELKKTLAIQRMKQTKPTYNEKLGKIVWGTFSSTSAKGKKN